MKIIYTEYARLYLDGTMQRIHWKFGNRYAYIQVNTGTINYIQKKNLTQSRWVI